MGSHPGEGYARGSLHPGQLRRTASHSADRTPVTMCNFLFVIAKSFSTE
jgi:hypothetical protein